MLFTRVLFKLFYMPGLPPPTRKAVTCWNFYGTHHRIPAFDVECVTCPCRGRVFRAFELVTQAPSLSLSCKI
jgi:hypothetical protein